MSFTKSVISLAAVWIMAVFYASIGAQTPTSVWNGAYSDAQAKRGAAAYVQECQECHSPELMGDGFAPALAGSEFLNAWNGLSVGDLFERIRISMPPGKESAVPPAMKADIVAYILKANKFPAGNTELAATTDALKGIKFEAHKPGE